MIKKPNIKFEQFTLNCFYQKLPISENFNKHYKNDKSIFIKNRNTRRFSYYLIFYFFNHLKIPIWKVHSKKNFFQNQFFLVKKTFIKKKLYKCFLLIKKDSLTIGNQQFKTGLTSNFQNDCLPITNLKKNFLKPLKTNTFLKKKNILFIYPNNSVQKDKEKPAKISTFLKQRKKSLFYKNFTKLKNAEKKICSFLDFLVLQFQLLIYQLKKTNKILNCLQLDLLYSNSLCLNFTFLFQILFGNNSFPFTSFKTFVFCSKNNNIITSSEKKKKIFVFDNKNKSFNFRLFFFIKRQISYKLQFHFFEQLKSKINTSNDFLAFVKNSILPTNCNFNLKSLKNVEKYVVLFSNLNINYKNLFKKKILENYEDKTKFFLNSFAFQKVGYFYEKKIVFYYFLIKIFEGGHKQYVKKQKRYLQFKQKIYLTKKSNLNIPNEFNSNLVIKRDNYGFSLLSKNILLFFEKISFFYHFLNAFNLLQEREFIKLNLFQTGFSHSLFFDKNCNINFEGLNIKYCQKPLPEYFTSINYRKKNNILFSCLFSKNKIFSQLVIFEFLFTNSSNFKKFHCQQNKSKQLKKLFFNSNEMKDYHVGSLYHFFIFSNKVNRQKLKYSKLFLNLSLLMKSSHLNLELFFRLFVIITNFILVSSFSFYLEQFPIAQKRDPSLLTDGRSHKHIEKKQKTSKFNGFKRNCFNQYNTYWLNINSFLDMFSSSIFIEKNSFKIPLITIFPAPANVRLHLSKIKIIIKKANNKTQENLIQTLSKEIKIWCSLYNLTHTKKIFRYCDYVTFKYLWRWACRRHPNKSKHWIKKKYFQFEKNKNWIFSTFQKKTQSLLILANHQ